MHLNQVSQPSSLLLILKPIIIYAKSDYGYFPFTPAYFVNRQKYYAILTSRLHSIVDALRSTPLVRIEMEYACPLLEVRRRWLAVRFLLKSLSSPTPLIFNIFSMCLIFCCSIAFSLSLFMPIIILPKNRLFFMTFFQLSHFNPQRFYRPFFSWLPY